VILENITEERAKIDGYYDTYLKFPETVLVPYAWAKARADPSKDDKRFPIFLDRVFVTDPGKASQPHELIATRLRRKLDERKVGKLLIFERTDNMKDTGATRLFLVWLSPALLEEFRANPVEKCSTPALVIFHPAGGLNKYPAYWNGSIKPFTTNFLELGVRYLFREKHVVMQALAALSPTMGESKLEAPENALKLMVVAPVSSGSGFYNLTDPLVLEDALKEISRRAFEAAADKPRLTISGPPITRVAVAGYSRSGEILLDLLTNGSRNKPFMENRLREIYAFDIMLERDADHPPARTRAEGYQQFWKLLKAWQGTDSDRLIRLYSAEPGTVGFIRSELQERRKRYGGGYENPRVPFSSFNGRKTPDGVEVNKLDDGYEIYSTDNSRLLACLPSVNARAYLSSEGLKNNNGFHYDEPFDPALEGHSWFISRLVSHALFHSHFW
jgi:hypothetical protein